MNEHDKMVSVNLVKEMKDSFLDYSMSVIVSRAIPDVRDGLKPVHRRILYTLLEEGMTPDKKHQKSANAVGAVMGHYHPHGDSAIYDSMVRMAQPFTYRHTLVDGHGNFGNIDGDGAAASRYTEAKLAKISMELLRDLNKNTVDFTDNYDGQRKEPTILPSRFPNILVNGNMGIAVGMATNIPPHNLGEVIDGCVAYIDNPDISIMELMNYIKGPDFPSGGIILGNSGIKKAFETGRGTITIRSRVEIEEHHGKNRIIITELPYQVNKKALIIKIAELIRDKVIDGVSGLTDESALGGVRIVIDVKKEANANVILNNLYKHTQVQMSYGINFLMLVDGRPRCLDLKTIYEKYVDHQKHVIYRRTEFDLAKYKARLHILEGLKIALDHIDEVIRIIKESETDEDASKALMAKYGLSEAQTNAILEMKLRRLTGLAKETVENEIDELTKLVAELTEILASEEKILNIIKTEMLEIKAKYADERKTDIDMTAIDYIEDESLIPDENVVITLTNKGYIKRMLADTYKTQNRGGVGIKGMTTNEEDFVESMINITTHDYVLLFTNLGRVYRLKGYEIPEFSRTAKGLPIVNLIQIEKDEYVKSMINISKNESHKYLLFATKKGIVKKTNIEEFNNIRATGKIAISMKDSDELLDVKKTSGNDLVLLGSSEGKLVKFSEDKLRAMGRTASGVKGINLDGNVCVACEIVKNEDNILIVTNKGYGKQSRVSDFRETSRGSKGVKALSVTEKNGSIVAVKVVEENKELVIMTNNGMAMRMKLEQINTLGRTAQGVRLINLKEDHFVTTISLVEKEDEIEEDLTEIYSNEINNDVPRETSEEQN
ncbi:MAG: DNA gyrase subunit A [Bacilli bacterium]|nr:DNA gyrase subunit A [Bacilli bacterium]